MDHCFGCGGIIGRDCYNPAECVEISHRIDSDNEQQAKYFKDLIEELEYQFCVLKEILECNNIPVPNFEPEKVAETASSKSWGFDDDLPF